jgi:hypothetical protein
VHGNGDVPVLLRESSFRRVRNARADSLVDPGLAGDLEPVDC